MAAEELAAYMELFGGEQMPEPAELAGAEKAWVLNKYGELRYKHRELLVRCEASLRESEGVHGECTQLRAQVEQLRAQNASLHVAVDEKERVNKFEQQVLRLRATGPCPAAENGPLLFYAWLWLWL
jgi:hypothetical protein